jgi:hypothetical protein
MCLLKLSFDQNLIIIYHTFNCDFKSYVKTQGGYKDNHKWRSTVSVD